MSVAMPLRELLHGAAELPGDFNPVISGLSLDSRELRAGDAFVALAGATTHGLRFIDHAQHVGVAAVLVEAPLPDGVSLPGNGVLIEGLRAKLGGLADRFYGSPSRAVVLTGVTGTNGKTSTVQLIAQALTLAGHCAGTIGTLGAGLYGAHSAGERTTPDVIAVHRLLARLRDAGATQVAMEVSSHALAQGRVDQVAFQVAVFTNLTRDHLDYHGSMQAYGEAKARLLHWPTLRCVVVNVDDAFGRELAAGIDPAIQRINFSSRGEATATLRALQPRLTPQGLSFELEEHSERHEIVSPLLGRFNVDNLLAVAGTLRSLGWTLGEVAQVLPRLSPVDGRMSRAGGTGGKPLVVVDYAHTPDALEQALQSLREHTPGRLTCVFGCGGERDRGKRAQMAAVAQRLADRVIVTDDNPRGEDGNAIVADILSGFSAGFSVQVQRDRATAISAAISSADNSDVLLVAGKGHETYQEIAGVKYPFDDLAIARRALEKSA